MKTSARPSKKIAREAFGDLSSRKDLAKLLDIKPRSLSYILYHYEKGTGNKLYKEFKITKKNGSKRTIRTPIDSLKKIQSRLNYLLNCVYWVKPSAHGFINKKSILTNALQHTNKRIILNIDIKDFFPSINFGRVRGLLLSKPYSLNNEVATTIAQIACYDNELPQGAPSSPVISNMICSKLDHELQNLAKSSKATYTRYADDITFSTNAKIFQEEILCFGANGELAVGDTLKKIITSNGFSINDSKTRAYNRDLRCEATGIVINKFPNVRRTYIKQVRAIIHDATKNGLAHAEANHYGNHYKRLNIKSQPTNFLNVIEGKIEFIRHIRDNNRREIFYKNVLKLTNNSGKTTTKDYLVERLQSDFERLLLQNASEIAILTEGKTDIIHIKEAWKRFSSKAKYSDMNLLLDKRHSKEGDGALKNFFYKENIKSNQPIICVFDKDTIWAKSMFKEGNFVKRKGSIYAIALPKPEHWPGEKYAIESYYDENVIKTIDQAGRRLYYSNEFNQSKSHKIDGAIYTTNDMPEELSIFHTNVYKKIDGKSLSIAMSKKNFAFNVIKKNIGKHRNRFTSFEMLFDLIHDVYVDFNKRS